MRRSRLITLTGPGGAGKTRLALRLASGVLERYPGGTWLVELGSLTDPTQLERAVAAACGVRETKNVPLVETLITRLAGERAVLLLLDGAEHLVDSCRPLCEHLLRGARELTIVVSSREALGVSGELIWRTPPLTLPEPGEATSAVQVMQSEAAQLFVDRAALARPGFVLERGDHMALAEICADVDGLPLAIELAASLVPAMSVREIRTRLLDHHRRLPSKLTLKPTIDWSYRLLSADEQRIFARLSIFAGGFDFEAAEAIAPDDKGLIQTLMALVNKSLVVANVGRPSGTRYRMLDTIREYAAGRLEPPLADELARLHAEYFLALAGKARHELIRGDQANWLNRIDEEVPNLRLALGWFEHESADRMMELAGDLARYWYVRGKLIEGLEWLDRALAGRTENQSARVPVLLIRARLRRFHGDYAEARRDVLEGLALCSETGDALHVAAFNTTLGNIAAAGADWEEAWSCFSKALAIYQRDVHEPRLIAGAINNLAMIESARGDHEVATVRIAEAVAIAERTEDRIARANIRETAGRIARRRGDSATARNHLVAALTLSSEFDDVIVVADALDGLALLATTERDATRALVLAAGAARRRSASDSTDNHWDHVEVESGITRARSMLDTYAADRAWDQGSAMSLAELVAFATGAVRRKRTLDRTALTGREMQVASLIAEGLTNVQIATRLNMADRTADAHAEHIRNKLGVRSRAQIAVWAAEKLKA